VWHFSYLIFFNQHVDVILQLALFWCSGWQQMMMRCVAVWWRRCSTFCHWSVAWAVLVGCLSLDLWPLLVLSRRQVS